jgi:DNA-binding response OmpR family regulator
MERSHIALGKSHTKVYWNFLTETTTSPQTMKILLIEDETALSDSVLMYLKEEGYICEWAGDFDTAQEKIELYEYDCVVVDIMLPDGSGLDIIRELKHRKIPAGIIIISAKNSLEDKIAGLEIGSDDYMTKPFHLSELNARLKALIRRRTFAGNQAIVFHEIRILPEQMQVFVHEENMILTKKEYDLLLYFIANPQRVLTKESIVEHLWGDESDSLDSFDFLYTHIKNLRKKLIEKNCQDYIQSVYGIGYKMSYEL